MKLKYIFIFIFFFLGSCSNLDRNYLHKKENGQRMQKRSSTYKVYGKHYHVMKSSKNYEETGVASWYGKRFNRKRTSSGERFNMYKMTAAHKTLPLATNVLVTNLVNGKKVIVKVNDRGPFVGNRVIDLSYGAAKKLGMVGLGTAAVNIKVLNGKKKEKA
jgi:peptidoglycan lytic transglycosylase